MDVPYFTVAKYLLHRLKQLGCDHIFGVAGDFVLGFLEQITMSDVQFIPTCNELNGAYAADGYARIKGIGCITSTFGVGELSALNGVAGAFAERVPVVVITGSPSTYAQKMQPPLHHTLGDYEIPYKMYKMITCAHTLLGDPEEAADEIDRVLYQCLKDSRPVYISIPSDIVHSKCKSPEGNLMDRKIHETEDKETLEEALNEAVSLIESAKKPIFVADVEIRRYKMNEDFKRLVEKTGIPFAVMIMGKTILDESHPQFVGIYQGSRSPDYVRKMVEEADCVVELGVKPTDFNTGGFTTKFPIPKSIKVTWHSIQIKHHIYLNISMKDFVNGLEKKLKSRSPPKIQQGNFVHTLEKPWQPSKGKSMTLHSFFDKIVHFIPQNSIVIAETGTSLFAAVEAQMPNGVYFLSQTFYGSIGYTVGAALGASIADPSKSVVLLVGDGSLQVTCQELSTMIRNNCNVKVFVINNDGYTIERVIVDGPFNDIQPWKYSQLPVIFGGSKGCEISTEEELENCLKKAKPVGFDLWEVKVPKMDFPKVLAAVGADMKKGYAPKSS